VIGIDSNVLVRYLTQDDARQAAIATRFIERDLSARRKGHVSLVAMAELAWVLRSRYAVTREELAIALAQVIADERFAVQDRAAVWAALDLYRTQAVDFGDALIAAVDRLHGCQQTVTFDRGAARIDGVKLLAA
jgi:predicted nucleic-acid-binding protein